LGTSSGMGFPESRTGRQFLLSTPKSSSVVHWKYRFSPHPSPQPEDSELPLGRMSSGKQNFPG